MNNHPTNLHFDLTWTTELAMEAGQLGLHYYRNTTAQLKPDQTIVTEGDRAIEEFLVGKISKRYPDDGILGEEGVNHQRQAARQWVLDPIDGTAVFSAGMPIWCVCIGLMINDEPAAGVIYMPVLKDLYTADLKGPATLNGDPIHVLTDTAYSSESTVLGLSDGHRDWDFDFPGKVRAFGSLAAHICYVAQGSAIATVNTYSSLWDIAAALPILERAGGVCTLLDGSPLPLRAIADGSKLPQPLLAASPQNIDDLRSRLCFNGGA